METFLVILMFLFVADSDKRIVLHSGADMAQELLAIRSELKSFKANISRLENENSELHNKISSLERELKASGDSGSIFVRWGRTVCPGNSSQTVYQGYTSGGAYRDSGGGSTVLCLPDNPTWGNYSLGLDGYKGYIYGVELDMIEPSHVFPHPVNDQDQPCVVCSSKYLVTHMFPGRVNCYPGWAIQFSGYLMSSYQGSAINRDYICMDSNPEASIHGASDDDQAVVYLVEGRCGSLPCPPYVDGREIACVVCSK